MHVARSAGSVVIMFGGEVGGMLDIGVVKRVGRGVVRVWGVGGGVVRIKDRERVFDEEGGYVGEFGGADEAVGFCGHVSCAGVGACLRGVWDLEVGLVWRRIDLFSFELFWDGGLEGR